MTPLPAPHAHWADEIAAAVAEEFDAVVTVKMPDAKGAYNPTTDSHATSTTGATLISSRAARIQPIGEPNQRDGQDGWSTEQRVRVQFAIQAGDPVIPKGAEIHVENGGRDATLESFVFQVIKSLNSSHAAVRTVIASSEG